MEQSILIKYKYSGLRFFLKEKISIMINDADCSIGVSWSDMVDNCVQLNLLAVKER